MMIKQFNRSPKRQFSIRPCLFCLLILFNIVTHDSLVQAQTKTDHHFISESKAISIAKRNQLITKLDPTPQTYLDTARKVWLISVSKTKHINEGKCNLNQPKTDTCNCKNTNGCTDMWSKKIRINAINGKVISKKTTRKRYANYE